jgi:hypothetical protein
MLASVVAVLALVGVQPASAAPPTAPCPPPFGSMHAQAVVDHIPGLTHEQLEALGIDRNGNGLYCAKDGPRGGLILLDDTLATRRPS